MAHQASIYSAYHCGEYGAGLNNSIRSFDFSFMLTAGGPGTTSELLASYMYKKAFSSMQYGYGSTLAVFIVVICFILASFCMKQFDRGGESHDQL